MQFTQVGITIKKKIKIRTYTWRKVTKRKKYKYKIELISFNEFIDYNINRYNFNNTYA